MVLYLLAWSVDSFHFGAECVVGEHLFGLGGYPVMGGYTVKHVIVFLFEVFYLFH